MQKVTHIKASRFVIGFKPFFPGYMFVSVNSDLAAWRTINSTMGVLKLVNFEGKPTPLPLQMISAFKLRCDESGTMLTPNSFNEGNHVEILTRPFANLIATIDRINPKQRIWVLTELMGQKTRIQVSVDQLQPAE